jgi:hypothetical protein
MKISLVGSLVLVAVAVFAAPAIAQTYKWVDKNGKTQYGDTPPPGVKATPLRGSSGSAAPAATDAKAASKGPLTPAEQEAAFRKRQAEAQKGRDKEEKTAQDVEAKKDNCARLQEQARMYESGQRISRTNREGERYYLEETQVAEEAKRARQLMQQQGCSGG